MEASDAIAQRGAVVSARTLLVREEPALIECWRMSVNERWVSRCAQKINAILFGAASAVRGWGRHVVICLAMWHFPPIAMGKKGHICALPTAGAKLPMPFRLIT